MSGQLLRVLQSGPCGAAFNMALDEALLEAANSSGTAWLRFYGWTEAAATFGYFQHYSEIERTTALRPLVRRPTGGGLVPHDADWTYSLAFPVAHAWYRLSARESYQRAHEWVAAALGVGGVKAALAPCCLRSLPGQCFVGYEQHDVLWQGRKVAGAAQRRNRLGLLIQGSVQPQPGFPQRAAWEQAMMDVAAKYADAPQVAAPPAELIERARELERARYGTEVYNHKR
jgi:lipoate-protein ligase A